MNTIINATPRHANLLFSGLLILVFAVLSGCSTVRVAYNQADTLLGWMANDYFDFDSSQKSEFNTRLDTLLKWHRQEQLPEYSRFLAEIKQRTQRAATREDALWLTDGAKARFRVLALKGAADATELLATLTPDNIQALEKRFDKINQDFVKEHKINGTQDERRRARLERTFKRIREWTGPLTPAQEERINALNDTIPYTDHLRHQERQRRQREFLALLTKRQAKGEFARTLRPWLADWEAGRPPEVKTALNEGYDKRIALYLEVERMLTPQQRQRLQQKIDGYIEDLNALAARNVAAK